MKESFDPYKNASALTLSVMNIVDIEKDLDDLGPTKRDESLKNLPFLNLETNNAMVDLHQYTPKDIVTPAHDTHKSIHNHVSQNVHKDAFSKDVFQVRKSNDALNKVPNNLHHDAPNRAHNKIQNNGLNKVHINFHNSPRDTHICTKIAKLTNVNTPIESQEHSQYICNEESQEESEKLALKDAKNAKRKKNPTDYGILDNPIRDKERMLFRLNSNTNTNSTMFYRDDIPIIPSPLSKIQLLEEKKYQRKKNRTKDNDIQGSQKKDQFKHYHNESNASEKRSKSHKKEFITHDRQIHNNGKDEESIDTFSLDMLDEFNIKSARDEEELLITLHLMKEKMEHNDEEILQRSLERSKPSSRPIEDEAKKSHTKFVQNIMKLKKADSVSKLPTFYIDRKQIKAELKMHEEKDLGIKFYLDDSDGMKGFKNAIEFQYHHRQIKRIQKSVQFSSAPKPLDYSIFRKGDQCILDLHKLKKISNMDPFRKKLLLNRISEITMKYSSKDLKKHDYLKKNGFPKYKDLQTYSQLTERNRNLLHRIHFVESSLQQNSIQSKNNPSTITSPYLSSPKKVLPHDDTPFQKYVQQKRKERDRLLRKTEMYRSESAMQINLSNLNNDKILQYLNCTKKISILPKVSRNWTHHENDSHQKSRFCRAQADMQSNSPNDDLQTTLSPSPFKSSPSNYSRAQSYESFLDSTCQENLQTNSVGIKNDECEYSSDRSFFITQHLERVQLHTSNVNSNEEPTLNKIGCEECQTYNSSNSKQKQNQAEDTCCEDEVHSLSNHFSSSEPVAKIEKMPSLPSMFSNIPSSKSMDSFDNPIELSYANIVNKIESDSTQKNNSVSVPKLKMESSSNEIADEIPIIMHKFELSEPCPNT